MKTSQVGIDLIKRFESVRLRAYKVQSNDQYYTIGFGHYGKDVKANSKITMADAESLLRQDLKRFEDNVNKYNHIYNFNQNEFDALVSFAYNTGSIDNLTGRGTRDRRTISMKMVQYTKSNGVVLAGLVVRRQAEQRLFNTPTSSTTYTGKVVKLKETDKIKVIVDKVLNGEFGNGEARKNAIYNSIQELVNARL